MSRIAAAGAALRGMTANPLGKPIGLQLYTVSAEMQKDFSGTLSKVAQIGIKEVEIASTYGKTAAEWTAALHNNGLHCRSVHLFDLNQSPEEVMNFSREVGAKYIVTSLNPPPEILAKITSAHPDWTALVNAVAGMTLDDWKKSAAIANQLGEQAAKHGLVYAYHNHNVEFKKFGNTTAFETLLASPDPATVKFEMDCGWVVAAGRNPVDYLSKTPERFPLLHVKDMSKKASGGFVSTVMGRGVVDYRPILRAATGLKHYFIEQEEFDIDTFEALRLDAEYMRKLSL